MVCHVIVFNILKSLCFSVSFFMSTLLYRTLRINCFRQTDLAIIMIIPLAQTFLIYLSMFILIVIKCFSCLIIEDYLKLLSVIQTARSEFYHHALICTFSLVTRLICGHKNKSIALRLLCIKALFPPLWLTSLSTLQVHLETSELLKWADKNLGSLHHTFLSDVTLQKGWVVLVHFILPSACFGIFIKGTHMHVYAVTIMAVHWEIIYI